MTRRIIHITLIVTGYFLLTAKSCAPDTDSYREAMLMAEKDSILGSLREDFESDYLLENSLQVYHEKARQKLLDLADYLSLYADKELDTLFKQQVKSMIIRFFNSGDVAVQLPLTSACPENKENHLLNLLECIDSANYKQVRFAVTDPAILEPLQLENSEHYKGLLGCRFRISGITEHDTVLLADTNTRVEIMATRISKHFGAEETMRVWQVSLADITAVNE